MSRDPHYEAIDRALQGPLDPLVFEECVVDLLRRAAFPSLVWIRGGTDAGVDGATAGGGPFIVCTTSRRVHGNVRRSLESYARSGGLRRAVVVACRDELTAKRRSNLEKIAEKLGFRILQIYERANVCRLLYRDSTWTRTLLGVTGEPPALSIMPPSTRPALNETLVGRDEDMMWLRETEDDRILAGPPGAGKTFALAELVRQGWGLFMVDSDPARLASAIRDQSPSVIIVDDLVATGNTLSGLMSLRTRLSASFDIVVAAWEEDVPSLSGTLCLEQSRVRTLELLDRDQMVEVVRGAGVRGPDRLIGEIVSQASGRPGLAATLCRLCIRGDVRRVVLGEALRNDLSAMMGSTIDKRAPLVLAALALGGDCGMDREGMCRVLGMSPVELSTMVREVAPSGVIRPAPERRLSIWPRALRHALLRDAFSGGMDDPLLEALLDVVPDMSQTAQALVGASASGASIPMLLDVLKAADSATAWSHYASLGQSEAEWVIASRPHLLEKTSEATLIHAPELSIRAMLAAPDEPESGWPFRDDPWAAERIEDWISSGDPQTDEAVGRRRLAISTAVSEVQKGLVGTVVQRTMAAGMSPGFRFSRSDPGTGSTGTFVWGVLSYDQLEEVRGFWSDAAGALGSLESVDWPLWFRVVDSWTHPGFGPPKLPEKTLTLARDVARQMTDDLASLAGGRSGVMQELRKRGCSLGCSFGENPDEEYTSLFPEEPRDFSQASFAALWEAAATLGRRWSTESPPEVAARVAQLEERAREAAKNWPRLTPHAMAAIAENCTTPAQWIEALVEAGAPPDLIAPFVHRALKSAEEGDAERVTALLTSDEYRRATAFAILTADGASSSASQAALASLDESDAGSVEMVVLRGEASRDVVRQMLEHNVPSIASAAAIGLWMADERGVIQEGFRSAWRGAIVKAPSDTMVLDDILASDGDLAFLWFENAIRGGHRLGRYDEAPQSAAAALSSGQRRKLVKELRDEYRHLQLAVVIVGDDAEAYKTLLERKEVASLHLQPLGGDPTDAWRLKAVAAMEAGYSARGVAEATLVLRTVSWSGSESEMWDGWVAKFAALENDDSPNLRAVGQQGAAIAGSYRITAERRERMEAVFGR